MTKDTVVQTYFAKLGLEPEIANIYIALYTYGPQTVSQLARSSGTERTRIYRLIDVLKSSKLVEVEVHYKREIFRAAPIDNLQLLLDEKEQDLRSMQDGLKELHGMFPTASLVSPTTRTQFYQGAEGNKQMFWNETRAQSEVLCVLYENMQIRVGKVFFNRWVRQCNENGIRSRGIISDKFMESQQTWYQKHQNERLEHWEQRTVSSEVFPITHSMVVYDNVVAYYNSIGDETFGIEIYNQEIAQAQRHLFELLWQMGSPARDVDEK